MVRTERYPGFADFRPAWNNGVSFSLLAQSSATGRYLLIAVLTVISIAVAVMAWRATNAIAAAADEESHVCED